MITRFDIKGFKTLVDVSVDLGAVNVFIGANGSGKSNLLEALGVFGAVVAGGPESESLRYRGVRQGTAREYLSSLDGQVKNLISMVISADTSRLSLDFGPSADNPTEWEIHREMVEDEYETITREENKVTFIYKNFESLKPVIRKEASLDKSRSFVFAYARIMSLLPISFRGDMSASAADRKSLFESIINYCIYTPSTPQLRGFLDDIRHDPLGLGGSGLGKAIAEMANEIPEQLGPFNFNEVFDLIEWADDLGTDGTGSQNSGRKPSDLPVRLRISDRYMSDSTKSISAIEASEGALYVLFLLALAGHPRSPKIFAVDNFDQALHPRLACTLTRLIAEQLLEDGSRQMLATTHNPLVLDGLNLLDDRIRLFAVDRDATGATQVDRVMVTEELMARANEGLSLSQLWLMGRLGGMPQNL